MNVQFATDNEGIGTLDLELTQSDITPVYQKKLKSYAANAKIKGFRQGKVPAQLVERMYGPSLKLEAINETINKSVTDYLREHELNYLGDLQPQESNALDSADADKYSFSFKMAMVPEITLPDFSSLTVTHYKVAFTPEEIKERIDQQRKRAGKLQEQESITDNSIVYADLCYDDKTTKTYLSLERMTEAGRAAFFGQRIGESVTVQLPEAFTTEELRKVLYLVDDTTDAPTGEGTFAIEKIQHFDMAELDMEFVENVLGIDYTDDEATVAEKYGDKMSANLENDYTSLMREQVIRAIQKQANIQLPEDFLRGIVEQSLKDNKKEVTEETIKNEIQGIRTSLIIDQLEKQLEVKVDYEDVVQETMNALVGSGYFYGQIQSEEQLREMATKMLTDKDRSTMRVMLNRARYNKVLDAAAHTAPHKHETVGFKQLQEVANTL